MKATAFLVGCLLTTLAWADANATVISMNSIAGSNPSASDPFTAGKIDALHITASGIGRGSGISANTGTDRYNAKGWTTAITPDANDYYTFTLDATAGYKISFTNFVYTGAASSSGPTAFAFRSSLDSFASNIGTPTASGILIDLSALQFQNLTDPVEFRLYGYKASSAAGTFSINDYTFNGAVDAVPEPQTLSLVGGGALLMLWRLRRSHCQSDMAG